MKQRFPNRFALSLAILAALFLRAASAQADPGSAAGNFLKIGVGSRAAGMGEAQSAVVDDVTASYWNPAALSQLRFQEVMLMHYAMVEGVRYQQAMYALPTERKGVFSLGLGLLDYGSIQGYGADSLPTGNVDASNTLLSASWARTVTDASKFSAGLTFKYLQSDLAGSKANAPILDAGLFHPFESGRLRGLRLAATLRNLGPDIKYASEASPLPRALVVGAGYSMLGGNLVTALDLVYPDDSSTYASLGVEYRLLRILNLRLGYNGSKNLAGSGLSYGMGLRYNNWAVDYAFVPFGDLGDTNRLSIGFRFGRAVQLKTAGDQVDNAFKQAQSQAALGNTVAAYTTLTEILNIAPWHKPSVEMKARIQKQFDEMAEMQSRAKMEAQIAEKFTEAKAAFDRDELVTAKKGFETILYLQPDHVGAKVYLERIQNRYASLAQESFKNGMDFFVAGEYDKAKNEFNKTLTIDETHTDAKAQLEKTESLLQDASKRDTELRLLASAESAYRQGLSAYQKGKWEEALVRFEEVQKAMPEYEEVRRYADVTKKTWAGVLFEESQVHFENGQLSEAVRKLERANDLTPDDPRLAPALDIARRDLDVKNAEESKRLYQRGMNAYLSGNTSQAEKDWKRALELYPQNEDAISSLKRLEEQRKFDEKK